MANYTPAEGYARNTKSKKRKKDPNAPKRPQTAFFVFSAKVIIASFYGSITLKITILVSR